MKKSGLIQREGTVLPYFLSDKKKYLFALDVIAKANSLD